MQVVRGTVIGVALFSLCASVTIAAQEPSGIPITRSSIGVSFGTSDPWWHYRQSGPADADKAISLEFRLAEIVGVKTELGTATWTLTGWPRVVRLEDGSFGQEPAQSDDVTATRLTVSYVGRARPHPALTIVWMTGGGYYRLSSATSDLRRDRAGAHVGAGLEIPVGERFAVGGHALHHAIFGRALTLSRSQIAMHTLFIYSASVDLRVYF